MKKITKSIWTHFMHDSLRRNSILLTSSQIIGAGFGFIFWVICARLFDVQSVGLASAFIAFGSLVVTFTNLGLSNTIIRFMPNSKNRRGLFNATLTVILASSIIGSLIAFYLMKYISPQLMNLGTPIVTSTILMGIVTLSAVSSIADVVLISFKKGQYVLWKTAINSVVRLILLVLFIGFGVAGILLPHIIAAGICIAYSLWVINSLIKTNVNKKRLDFKQLYEHKTFAFGNYTGGLVGALPASLVPIIILNQLGAQQAAYFYIAFQLATFLNLICSSASQALFAEASQDPDTREARGHLRKAFFSMYQMLIPSIILLGLLGYYILRIYGSDYADNGYLLLVLLLLSSLSIGVNWLGDTWLNIHKKMHSYFAMNALNSSLVVGFVYLFAPKGLVWVGIGWLLAQTISAIIYILIFEQKTLQKLVDVKGGI